MFIVGISGKMGRELTRLAAARGVTVTGGLDTVKSDAYPTFERAKDVNVPIDVVVDFSRPATLDQIIELCTSRGVPCVLATTGYSDSEQEKIKKLAAVVAVFKAENMSVGINALSILAERAAAILRDFDIEIIERHHNQKADAPSGTAKLLARSIERGLDYSPHYVYGRSGATKRERGDIGIHAVRGGSIVGEHEIAFCGAGETVTLSHSAQSREIFADGAIRAAQWIIGKPAGLYDMRDLIVL